MKHEVTNHEVLLFTNTSFSKKQFCEKDDKSAGPSMGDHLQGACWNGLVLEILPDIIKQQVHKKCTYTWEVLPAIHFMEIKMGAQPFVVSPDSSINPYLFCAEKNLN